MVSFEYAWKGKKVSQTFSKILGAKTRDSHAAIRSGLPFAFFRTTIFAVSVYQPTKGPGVEVFA